ncbi:uncharacterized protein LOC126981514 [Eriocheir sinensis]|uniref:uncharacterized protein LOC126981514 n=1 Tax=Eriocheir sinensis TaxID=95602 RepID=UPI0021C8483B|nr:uncharacterized protein LOC126981514 [Eriocheir sinensis]
MRKHRNVVAAVMVGATMLLSVFVYLPRSFAPLRPASQLPQDPEETSSPSEKPHPPPLRPRPASSHCKSMFTIDKEDPDTVWDSDAPYEALAQRLPPLLGEMKAMGSKDNISAQIFLGTRLEPLGGAVPYIPCLVREFGAAETGECVAARAARGASTWIAFVGDSNQRQKVHSFLDFLPRDLAYSYYLGDEQVSLEVFTNEVIDHKHRPPVFEIIGRPPPPPPPPLLPPPPPDSYVLKVTLVWHTGVKNASLPSSSPFPTAFSSSSSSSSSFSSPLPPSVPVEDRLRQWVEEGTVPDVVVVAFGTWMLLSREHGDELKPFTELEEAARLLQDALTLLAERTTLLFWLQSRYRWFNDGYSESSRDNNERKGLWKMFLYLNQFGDAIPLVDAWLWRTMRKTGAWLWDSTLPFNLANLGECRKLSEAGLSTHPFYTGRWWNCFDFHHGAFETNSVEIQMLLNLLCNAHLDTPRRYCCAGP